MKTLIQSNGGYTVYAEIREAISPKGLVELRVLTQWDNAKDPEDVQVKFSMMLTPEDRQRLKDFL
jgi:hypothetical protein